MTSITNPLDDATKLIKEGRYERARIILLELIKKEPKNIQAQALYQLLPNVKQDDPWIPADSSWRERYLNGRLVVVLVALILTATSTILASQNPTNFLTTFLNLFLTFILGFVVDEWVQGSRNENLIRKRAIEISENADAELQRMKWDLDRIVKTLREVSHDPKDGLSRSTIYILNELLRTMQSRLSEYALDISKLPGVNHNAFLKAKGEKLGQISTQTTKTIKDMFPKVDEADFFVATENNANLLPVTTGEND